MRFPAPPRVRPQRSLGRAFRGAPLRAGSVLPPRRRRGPRRRRPGSGSARRGTRARARVAECGCRGIRHLQSFGDRGVFLVLGRQVEHLLDASERPEGLVHARDRAEGRTEGPDQHEEEDDERHEAGDLDRPGCDAEAADAEHHEQRHLQRDAGDRDDEGRDLRDPHAMPYASVASDDTCATSRSVAPEARTVRIEPTARSTPEASSPTLTCCSVDAVRMRPLSSTTTVTETPITMTMSCEQERVDDRHRDEGADEDERAADRIREALCQHGVEQGRVGADARDEVAGAARVELADRQVQDARDELAPARVDDRGAGALQQVVLVARDDRRDDDESDEQPDEQTERASRLHALDDLPDQQRLNECRRPHPDAEDRDDDQHPLVLEEEGKSWRKVARGPSGWGRRPRPRVRVVSDIGCSSCCCSR